MAVGDTVIEIPVTPVDQVITPPSQPLADRTTLSPGQMASFAHEITGAVTLITTMFSGADGSLLQPFTVQVAV